ncbi:hypothetical protein ACFQ7N_10705 [Streptomyces niveus]|uniref:hypothetical protein n=1 Tax=Streptomyces niveus TaxID=193462 RepID=UPI00369F247B
MTDIRDCVQAMLRQNLADEQARQERISSYEKNGRRVVNGGQTGESSWEITDWRTGDVLATGTGGYDAYDDAARRLDPGGRWIHVDHFDVDFEDEEDEPEYAPGVPASLAEALREWLDLNSTPNEDVAVVAGWSAEEVDRHRR